MLLKQRFYHQNLLHDDTIFGVVAWWLLKKNKYCKKCCLFCRYYFRCQEDMRMIDYFDKLGKDV